MSDERALQPAPAPQPLSAEELAYVAPETKAPAAEPAQDAWQGQERALGAIEMGLAIDHSGYNIYACGLEGTHRERELADLIRGFLADKPIPGDRVLVHNFSNPDRPKALDLPAGAGCQLRKDIHDLIEDLESDLPKTFRGETFEEEKESLTERYGREGEEIQRQLTKQAAEAGFALQLDSSGDIGFIPIKDGKPMTQEELEALGEQGLAEQRERRRKLMREVKSVMRRQTALVRQLSRGVRQAERRVAAEAIRPLIDEIDQRYDSTEVSHYLRELADDLLDNLQIFQEAPPQPMPFAMFAPREDARTNYEVNVLVDNGDAKSPPVLVEPWPTYRNLFGAIERVVDRQGKLVSNFTRVTAGSLLRASGGCLVINLRDLLSEPLVWRALKECLKRDEVEIETYDPFAMFTASTVKPEPTAISTRVVLTGPDYLFQLLFAYDDEFREIFKVRADFGRETDAGQNHASIAAQIERIVREEGLLPLDPGARPAILEQAARSVGDRRKLPTQWDELGDLLREASYWAGKAGHDRIESSDIDETARQRDFHNSRTETKIREMIRDRTLLVDVDGSRIGQVNGLAVLGLGGYRFGRPSRITAVTSPGAHGVIAIDREAKLSGKTYDKGVLIISGYLRHVYAQSAPLSLSASLAFEQSYSPIDGDSASAADLFAIISSLSRVPLRQDLAVTGSVNQFGDVQPVGGVTEKVEGFFRTCEAIGLTGKQGVILPKSNVDQLLPDRALMDAIAAGTFSIYPIETIDQGLELLTGIRAGTIDEAGTVHHAAAEQLTAFGDALKRRKPGNGAADASDDLGAAGEDEEAESEPDRDPT